LQRKGSGNTAGGVTQEEFSDKMKDIHKKVRKKVKKVHPDKALEILEKITFSFDNAAFHNCPQALATKAGIQPSQRVPLPAWAPDFQQPIEHAHGRFKTKMRKEVDRGYWPEDLDEFLKKCKKVWKEVNSSQVVSWNVERLEKLATYDHVESKGGWAPKSLS